ncbi:unnamed protein product [Caretta caretta]
MEYFQMHMYQCETWTLCVEEGPMEWAEDSYYLPIIFPHTHREPHKGQTSQNISFRPNWEKIEDTLAR